MANELMNIGISQGEQTMTSREVAELTGKRHDNVMRDCKVLDEYYVKNERPQIIVDQYLAGNGEQRPQLELTKRQALDLCMGYSLDLRILLTDRWEELEKQKLIPQSFAEALQLAADQAKEIEIQAINHSHIRAKERV